MTKSTFCKLSWIPSKSFFFFAFVDVCVNHDGILFVDFFECSFFARRWLCYFSHQHLEFWSDWKYEMYLPNTLAIRTMWLKAMIVFPNPILSASSQSGSTVSSICWAYKAATLGIRRTAHEKTSDIKRFDEVAHRTVSQAMTIFIYMLGDQLGLEEEDYEKRKHEISNRCMYAWKVPESTSFLWSGSRIYVILHTMQTKSKNRLMMWARLEFDTHHN